MTLCVLSAKGGWQGKKIITKNACIAEFDLLQWERTATTTPIAPDNSLISVVGSGFPGTVPQEKPRKHKGNQPVELKSLLKSTDKEPRDLRKSVRFQSPIEEDPYGIPNMCIKGKAAHTFPRYDTNNLCKPSSTSILPALNTSPYYLIDAPHQSRHRDRISCLGDLRDRTYREKVVPDLPKITPKTFPAKDTPRGRRERIGTDVIMGRGLPDVSMYSKPDKAWNASDIAFDHYTKMKKRNYSLY